MKKLLFITLALISINCFGQKTLEADVFYRFKLSDGNYILLPGKEVNILFDNNLVKINSNEDVLIISNHTSKLPYVEDSKLGMVLKGESIYHNGIKAEVGQEWICLENHPFNYPIIQTITDIKGDYIQYINKGHYTKHSQHKSIFFISSSRLLSTEKGYVTRKGKVSGINTKDINPEPPNYSIIIGRRIFYNDSMHYYFNDVNNKPAN